MGRRATNLTTPVPVLGIPALVGVRGGKTLEGERVAGALTWSHQCSIGVQTSPGIGKPAALPSAKLTDTQSDSSITQVLKSYSTKDPKCAGITLQTKSHRQQGAISKQRSVELKSKKEVTFKAITGETSSGVTCSQSNYRNHCYTGTIKTNPHFAGNLENGRRKRKINIRYTNGSVVDSEAIGGISSDEVLPKVAEASLEGDRLITVGQCAGTSGKAKSLSVAPPLRIPHKICNQCGGRETVSCRAAILGGERPLSAWPKGNAFNSAPYNENPRDSKHNHLQHPESLTHAGRSHSLSVTPRLSYLNAELRQTTTLQPSCPVHCIGGNIPTPIKHTTILHSKQVTVTKATIEIRHDASLNSPESQSGSKKISNISKPLRPTSLKLPPQLAIATKANNPLINSHPIVPEEPQCVTTQHKGSNNGCLSIQPTPGNTVLPVTLPQSIHPYKSTLPQPASTPNATKISTPQLTLEADVVIQGQMVPNSPISTKPINSVDLAQESNAVKQASPSISALRTQHQIHEAPADTSAEMEGKSQIKTNVIDSTSHTATPQINTILLKNTSTDTIVSCLTNMTKAANKHVHAVALDLGTASSTALPNTTTKPCSTMKPFKTWSTPTRTGLSNFKTIPYTSTSKPSNIHCAGDPFRSLGSTLLHPPQLPHLHSKLPMILTRNRKVTFGRRLYKIIPLRTSLANMNNSTSAAPTSPSIRLISNPKSNYQSPGVSSHTSSDASKHAGVLDLDSAAHTNKSYHEPTSPRIPTPSHNDSDFLNGVSIHQNTATSKPQSLTITPGKLSQPIKLSQSEKDVHVVNDCSEQFETNYAQRTQLLHGSYPSLEKAITTLTMRIHPNLSDHTSKDDISPLDATAESNTMSHLDTNKDNSKWANEHIMHKSKLLENHTDHLQVTKPLNYISKIMPQSSWLQALINTHQQTGRQHPGCKGRNQGEHCDAKPQVRTTKEMCSDAERCSPGRHATGELDNHIHSNYSTSSVGAQTTNCEAPAAVGGDDDSTAELPGHAGSDPHTSRPTPPHTSPPRFLASSNMASDPTRDAASASLPHLRSRGTQTVVEAVPPAYPNPAPLRRGREEDPSHPPDAALLLRCRRSAELQQRLETVEAGLAANKDRISTLLNIIQDLEMCHAPSSGCQCHKTRRDAKSCTTCQRTACVVYSVEYDFRQQERRFLELLNHPSSEGDAFPPPHNLSALRDALVKKVSRSKVKGKKLCKTLWKWLPRKIHRL